MCACWCAFVCVVLGSLSAIHRRFAGQCLAKTPCSHPLHHEKTQIWAWWKEISELGMTVFIFYLHKEYVIWGIMRVIWMLSLLAFVTSLCISSVAIVPLVLDTQLTQLSQGRDITSRLCAIHAWAGSSKSRAGVALVKCSWWVPVMWLITNICIWLFYIKDDYDVSWCGKVLGWNKVERTSVSEMMVQHLRPHQPCRIKDLFFSWSRGALWSPAVAAFNSLDGNLRSH